MQLVKKNTQLSKLENLSNDPSRHKISSTHLQPPLQGKRGEKEKGWNRKKREGKVRKKGGKGRGEKRGKKKKRERREMGEKDGKGQERERQKWKEKRGRGGRKEKERESGVEPSKTAKNRDFYPIFLLKAPVPIPHLGHIWHVRSGPRYIPPHQIHHDQHILLYMTYNYI